MSESKRTAFTLVELLVVIAIIGILVALLLPAIQAARESARRIQCQNHLKQLAIALNGYEGDHKRYPIGVRTGANSSTGYGWGFYILPYLEEPALHERLKAAYNLPGGSPGSPPVTEPPPEFIREYFSTHANQIIPGGETILSVFRCPSSELNSRAIDSYEYCNGYGTSDYKACNGKDDRGMFFTEHDGLRLNPPETKVRPVDITDGLSKTIAVGESAYFRISDTVNLDWPIWLGASHDDETTLFKTDEDAPLNCAIYPKSEAGFRLPSGRNDPPGPIDDDCAYSWHGDGIHYAFADCSVHFILETVNAETYYNLGTKDDGEVVGEF